MTRADQAAALAGDRKQVPSLRCHFDEGLFNIDVRAGKQRLACWVEMRPGGRAYVDDVGLCLSQCVGNGGEGHGAGRSGEGSRGCFRAIAHGRHHVRGAYPSECMEVKACHPTGTDEHDTERSHCLWRRSHADGPLQERRQSSIGAASAILSRGRYRTRAVLAESCGHVSLRRPA